MGVAEVVVDKQSIIEPVWFVPTRSVGKMIMGSTIILVSTNNKYDQLIYDEPVIVLVEEQCSKDDGMVKVHIPLVSS